jgi:Bacterial Ig-like domain
MCFGASSKTNLSPFKQGYSFMERRHGNFIPQQNYAKPIVDYADAAAELLDPNKVPLTGTTVRCRYSPVVGQRVDVFWEGLVGYEYFQEVLPGGASEIVFPITQALVIANLNTTVYVSYMVNGIPSAVQPLRIQAGIGVLPPPTVVEAPTTVLNPMNALNGATARVAYTGMAVDDIIGLSWAGNDSLVHQQQGHANGTLDFLIPVSAVAAALGKTVQVIYAVVRGAEVEPSGILPLTVSAIPTAQLPTPTINQAPDQVLDLSTFLGDATVFVAIWPLIAMGQTFWLSVAGTLANGSPWTWSAAPAGYPIGAIDVANGLGRAIPRTELETLRDGSNLTVTCKVGFDGGPNEAGAVTFPVATFMFRGVSVAPAIIAVTGPNGSVSNGGTTSDTSLTLTGTATSNSTVEILEGGVRIGTATVGANGIWTTAAMIFALGTHNLTARVVGGTLVSGPWVFTINTVTLPLTIDRSTLTLNGAIVRYGKTPTNPPSGSYATRTATGGTPPYTYTTSNANVTELNANTGHVISFANGQATITVRDRNGQSASYPVSVSNVLHIDGFNGRQIYRNATSNAHNYGGNIPTMAEWYAFRATYGGAPELVPPTGSEQSWSRDSAGGNLLHCIAPNTGATSTEPDVIIIIGGRGIAIGWTIVNRSG